MSHEALRLIPGVDTNRTEALNEAAISSCNLIRFMQDRAGIALPQKRGGWDKYIAQQMTSDVKALHAWADSNAEKHLAVGMTGGLATITDGMVSDRSPRYYEWDAAVDFSTTSGNQEVDIVDTGSNIGDNDSVFIMTPVSVGGIVMFGLYSAIAQTDDQYSVNSANTIGLPLPATATVANGGAVPTFDTTSGTSLVEVTLADHGLNAGGNFSVLIPVSVGGLTIARGNYTVVTVIDADTFTIFADGEATSTDSEDMNGGLVRFRYYIGRTSQPAGSGGYGTGGYGRGGYGVGVTTGIGREFATTAGSGVGTTATLEFAEDFEIPVGAIISVEGVTPAEYNGNFTVDASAAGSPSTVTYDAGATITGPVTIQGTITITQWPFIDVEDWTLDNWGGDLVATERDGAINIWSPIDGGVNASIVPNSPTKSRGALVGMPQRQIIAYGTTDFNDIQDPLLVRWCDINNYSRWRANATNQAGGFRLSSGSEIVGAMRGSAQIVLWTDLSVWSMQYVSLPGVYAFNEIATGCGLIAQKAVASQGGTTYWMSQSQFFKMGAGGLDVVPCTLWDTIFQEIDMDYVDNIRAAANSRFNEVEWYYPTVGSGGVPTKYVKYNTLIGQWDYGTLTRTAWIDQSVFGPPMGSGSDRYIYQHETSYDADGQAMDSWFQTGMFALAEGNELMFLDQMWPDMKWAPSGSAADTTGTVNITFYASEYPSQTPYLDGPHAVTKASTFVTPRFRGRLVSIRVGSDDVGSFWRLGNVRYRVQPDGRFL